jgi:hypothetical protein
MEAGGGRRERAMGEGKGAGREEGKEGRGEGKKNEGWVGVLMVKVDGGGRDGKGGWWGRDGKGGWWGEGW